MYVLTTYKTPIIIPFFNVFLINYIKRTYARMTVGRVCERVEPYWRCNNVNWISSFLRERAVLTIHKLIKKGVLIAKDS